MAISRSLLLVAATLAVLYVGSANAWYPPKCPAGFKDCNPHKPGCETCILTDPKNCGGCGKCCKTLPYTVAKCVHGSCKYTCKPGYGNCDYNLWKNGCEKSLSSDPKNCGQCGKCCPVVANANSVCKYGKCCPPVCKPGYADCDYNIWKNGCETSTSSDPKNCGKCGNCCISPPNAVSVCSGGKCTTPVCKPGYGDCDYNWKNGCEKSLTSDIFNCGKCGTCCIQPPNAVSLCSGGKCTPPTCKPLYGNCDGNWTNGCEKSLSDDIFNCGTCGYCCPVTLKGGEATCSAGKCGQQCKAGTKFDAAANCCVPIVPY